MKYISVSEIAKIWGISVRRVNTLCNEGRIEGHKEPEQFGLFRMMQKSLLMHE